MPQISRAPAPHAAAFTRSFHGGSPGMRQILRRCSVNSQDLLIVGPGVLGGLVGKLWKDLHADAVVLGQTNSSQNHAR